MHSSLIRIMIHSRHQVILHGMEIVACMTQISASERCVYVKICVNKLEFIACWKWWTSIACRDKNLNSMSFHKKKYIFFVCRVIRWFYHSWTERIYPFGFFWLWHCFLKFQNEIWISILEFCCKKTALMQVHYCINF